MSVKLIHVTPDAEKTMAYCARVSSLNQENKEYEKLLKYCISNRHWSVFEMASVCIEITTSRAVAQQILRHRSFHFQEFSQRYSAVTDFETYSARRQDNKNRQNSVDDMSEEDKIWFDNAQDHIQLECFSYYKQALARNIAKEQARFLLPLSTQTKLYMHGTVRDFLHYVELRCDNGTQQEHKNIANEIKEILKIQLPTIAKVMNWL